MKKLGLRFYGQNLAFPQHNTTTVHRWDMMRHLLYLSYTWSKSRSCNSPMYHLISNCCFIILSLVSPSGMPKSKPWDLPKIGIHDVNDVWDLDFPIKPQSSPLQGAWSLWTKYGIDVSFSVLNRYCLKYLPIHHLVWLIIPPWRKSTWCVLQSGCVWPPNECWMSGEKHSWELNPISKAQL